MTRYVARIFRTRRMRLSVLLVFSALALLFSAELSNAQHLYVGTQAGVSVFDLNARGNAAPTRQLNFPYYVDSNQIAFGPNDDLYICGGYPFITPAVYVYGPHAQGNAQPINVIGGSNTTFVFPNGIAVDRAGYIYVSDHRTLQIDVFAPGATGNATPVRIITGSSTLLNGDDGALVTDPAGDLFLNQGGIYNNYRSPDEMLEFAAGSNGNVAPIAALVHRITITFNNVGLANKELFVSEDTGDQSGGVVGIYDLSTLHRIQLLVNSKMSTRAALGADMDANGNLYVLTSGRGSDGVWIFDALKGHPGHVMTVPSGTLGGSRTGFSGIASDIRVGP